MKQCRIVITTECNLTCTYCLMKDQEVVDTFTPKTVDDIVGMPTYSTYLITGGEPTTDMTTLLRLIKSIHENHPDSRIYLYSNGTLLSNKRALALKHAGLHGINIGLHNDIDYAQLWQLNSIIPLRLHRYINIVTPLLRKFCAEYSIPLKEWEMGQCDTEDEDRFILIR